MCRVGRGRGGVDSQYATPRALHTGPQQERKVLTAFEVRRRRQLQHQQEEERKVFSFKPEIHDIPRGIYAVREANNVDFLTRVHP